MLNLTIKKQILWHFWLYLQQKFLKYRYLAQICYYAPNLWEYPCNLPQSDTTPMILTLGQELANHKSLERHMVIQHPTQDATDLVCEICAYSTPSKDKLRAHKFAKHEVEKHKQCPLCDFKSPTKVWIL